ncbi:NB-ARC domain-containing protein [Streptomyces sp. NBC_01283]|uniref:AfsR/SARP family transcriptional regulator n=1 Tax=Streptomyces sp. NBC_01283 TaxID=2903812 RepID=UPI00352D457D|nr:NB-ARC domain-containing protein [Streptomyces sp. NBC_01283]
MEFQLLGPVTVAGGSGSVPLGPAKRSSLLAALLLRAGTPVSVDALTETLWDGEPPMHARTVIQGHISRLRALLVEAGLDAYGVELATQGGAYSLQLPETLLDVNRFEDLVTLAGRQREASDAALMLREALALWNGPALTGTVATEPMLAAARSLEESRLVTVEQLADAYGRLGSHGQAVGLLTAESVQHPLRESLVAALMRALQRCGRQSEALEYFNRTRELLAEELGVDPGKKLRRAYEEILAGEPDTGAHPMLGNPPPRRRGRYDLGLGGAKAAPAAPGAPASPGAPAFPAAPAGPGGPGTPGAPVAPAQAAEGSRTVQRVGPPTAERGRESGDGRARLTIPGADSRGAGPAATGPAATGPAAPAAPAEGPPPGPVIPRLLPRAPRAFAGREEQLAALKAVLVEETEAPIVLLTGAAGVGKTALALQWAHHHAAPHPDGQLFADLRGFSGGAPAHPERILRELLLALGVRQQEVPAGIEPAAALYRSLLAERRVLVVLDNAHDSAQVRPLLPGAPHCTTLITSRNRLDGLVASDCARPVPVGMLGERDGAELFLRALGQRAGLDADSADVREIARLCDGLPLALRIAAARLIGRPQRTVAGLAAELADGEQRLALLSAEDTGVAAALRTSVAQLPGSDTRLLAWLAHASTPDVDAHAASALAGMDVAAAHQGLDRLAAAHLIREEGSGRYVLHDLVRLFARGLEAPGPAAAPRPRAEEPLRSVPDSSL